MVQVEPPLERATFRRWLAAYRHAWETGNAAAVIRLFTADAAYHETPFAEPLIGHAAIHRYWSEGAKQAQRQVHFSASILALDGRTGIAHWRACFERVPSGQQVQLDGILTADLDNTGRCQRFREWWHRRQQGGNRSSPH